jgi:exopolyphosphatase/guanosine-5'-triphosphate,3'-diphosphate pyrophosphatase
MSVFAAIDVGSNAVRLSVVEISAVGAVVDSEFHRWPVRLGADSFAHGGIGAARASALLAVFREIDAHLERLGVDAYRAVATSAVREANNGRALMTRVRRETGLVVEIIDGHEEGRLAREALAQALGGVPRGTLLVDLGGGSMQLRRAGIGRARSLPFGTVRLLRRYPALTLPLSAPATRAQLRLVERDLRRRLHAAVSPLAVGTGGNLDVLARLCPARDGFHPTIDTGRLAALARRIAATPPGERMRAFGLRHDRADVIVPAALVVLALSRIFGVRQLVVPGTGIRERMLRQLAEQSATDGVVRALVRALPRRRSGRRLDRCALLLFEQFQPVHGLWSRARVPLVLAAHLAEGARLPTVEADARRRLPATLPGAIAALALGGTLPRLRLGRADGRAVRILAGLVRLALALAPADGEVHLDLRARPLRLVTAGRPRLQRWDLALLRTALGMPFDVG